MPIHTHPVFRALEEALESEGLVVTLNSAGLNTVAAAEASGARIPKVVPVQHKRIIRGNVYVAS